MIVGFRHAGLKALYQGRMPRRVSAGHLGKLQRILAALDQAETPADLDLPGFRLHSLEGKLKGRHAVQVSGNWRVTFRFEGTNVTDIDYTDYH